MRAHFVLTVLLVVAPVAMAQSAVAAGLSWNAADTTADSGIRPLNGADGAFVAGEREGSPCITNQTGATPPSQYLYFDVTSDTRALVGPLYLVVEYFGGGAGGVIGVEYDSSTGDRVQDAYRRSEKQWGGWLVGPEGWKRAVYRLDAPGFKGRQNLGADFRLSGTVASVRAVSLTSTQPADVEALAAATRQALEPQVRIGEGGQFIVGGFDPASLESAMTAADDLERAMPGLKMLGVTSHEGYVRWNLCEPEPGRYDWSVYDRFVDLYRKYEIKWVPFLIVGSAYSLPEWYYKKPGSQGYVCLEHGEQTDVESLWNPVLREHVARFIKAFCEHYGPTGVIESILLGVTGNYGEAIYVASGNDWTADVHGEYHTHPGLWAGDPYAVADFRAWLRTKYGTPAALSAAWGASVSEFQDVATFLQKDAPSDRAWLDFCAWYIGSMTQWSRFWMMETRKHYPGGIYLCTGGHAPAEHGADFGDQCKLAAEVGGGVRITNEASDYKMNFTLTRWVASGGRQYGAYFSFEPAGEVTPRGVIARIYNATASGALGLHYYYGNLFGAPAATANFVTWGGYFTQRTPSVEIFIHYPETYIQLRGNAFLKKLEPLRDRFDFGYLSDAQILDGGLLQAKALVLVDGNIAEAPVWRAVVEWVNAGGVIVYADGMGRLRTVEGNESAHDALFAKTPTARKGRAAVFHGSHTSTEYRDFVVERLREATELSPASRAMVAADGREDEVFVTLTVPETLLWLNYTDQDVERGGLRLPALSIVEQPLR